ncbi:hypothetical protein F4679DRAFT_542051 [Xylaria curta]|nr:hypothetical protein F4679DRAFT_542051 [Xylaria curta]
MPYYRQCVIDNAIRFIRILLCIFIVEPMSVLQLVLTPNLMLLIISTSFAIFWNDVVGIVNSTYDRFDSLVSSISIIIEAFFTIAFLSFIVYLAYIHKLLKYWYLWSTFLVYGPFLLIVTFNIFMLYRTTSRYLQDRRYNQEFKPLIVFTAAGEPTVVLTRTQAAFNPAFNASIDSLLQPPDGSYRMEDFHD